MNQWALSSLLLMTLKNKDRDILEWYGEWPGVIRPNLEWTCEKDTVMKCVILAGGLGTRLSEETYLKPKPMVEIVIVQFLWHIMKKFILLMALMIFIICCGYKGPRLKNILQITYKEIQILNLI